MESERSWGGGKKRASKRRGLPNCFQASHECQFGWLKSAESFAKALAHQPNTDYRVFNDRPTRPAPHSGADWKEIDRMLEEFRHLAPLWVEMKLLRP